MADEGTLNSSPISISSEKGFLTKRKDFLGKDEKANIHPNRTYYFKRHQDLNEIIDTCTKKLQDDPSDARALYLRGSSYFKKNLLPQCIRDLSALLHGDPAHLDGLYTRGLAYFKCNQHQLAIHDLSRLLQHNPDHVNAAYTRAACYNKMGLLAQAIEDYNFALSKDQSNGSVYGNDASLSSSFPAGRDTDGGAAPPETPLSSSSSRDEFFPETPRSSGSSSAASSAFFPRNPVYSNAANGNAVYNNATYGNTIYGNAVYGRGESTPTSGFRGRTLSMGSATEAANVQSPLRAPQNKRLDAFDGAGILSLYEDDYDRDRERERSGSRARLRVESHDSSYVDSVASPAASSSSAPPSRRPSLVSLGSASNGNAYGLHGSGPARPSTPTGLSANGFSFRSFSDIKATSRSRAVSPSPSTASLSSAMRERDRDRERERDAQGEGKQVTFADDERERERDRDRERNTNNSISRTQSFRGPSPSPSPSLSPTEHDESLALADRHHAEAYEHRKRGDFPAAIESYSRALSLCPTHFKALFNRGFALDKLGRFEDAVRDYSAAIAVEPQYPLVYYNRGIALDHMDQCAQAMDDFSTAIALYEEKMVSTNNNNNNNGNGENTVSSLSVASLPLSTQRSAIGTGTGTPHNALSQHTQPPTQHTQPQQGISQSYVDFYQNRAFCAKKLSLFVPAVQDFSKVLSLCEQLSVPQNSPLVVRNYRYKAAYHRAACLERLSRLQDAVLDISFAINEWVAIHNHSNNSTANSGNNTNNSSSKINGNSTPGTVQAHWPVAAKLTISACLQTRGTWLLQLGKSGSSSESGNCGSGGDAAAAATHTAAAVQDFSQALQWLQSALSSSSSSGNSGNNNGNCNANATAIAKQQCALLALRGKTYLSTERVDLARDDFAAIVSLSLPTMSSAAPLIARESLLDALSSHATCCKATQQHAFVVQDYQYALQLCEPNREQCVSLYLELATAHKKMDQFDRAIDAYSRAIELSPQHVKAYNARAFLFAKMGRFEDAVKDYSTVIYVDPDNSHAYHNRGISYDKLGLIDQAIADFSKVFELDARQSSTSMNAADPATAAVNAVAMMSPPPAAPPTQHTQHIQLAQPIQPTQYTQLTQPTERPPLRIAVQPPQPPIQPSLSPTITLPHSAATQPPQRQPSPLPVTRSVQFSQPPVTGVSVAPPPVRVPIVSARPLTALTQARAPPSTTDAVGAESASSKVRSPVKTLSVATPVSVAGSTPYTLSAPVAPPAVTSRVLVPQRVRPVSLPLSSQTERDREGEREGERESERESGVAARSSVAPPILANRPSFLRDAVPTSSPSSSVTATTMSSNAFLANTSHNTLNTNTHFIANNNNNNNNNAVVFPADGATSPRSLSSSIALPATTTMSSVGGADLPARRPPSAAGILQASAFLANLREKDKGKGVVGEVSGNSAVAMSAIGRFSQR